MSDGTAKSTMGEVKSSMLATLTIVEAEQPMPLMIVDGDNVEIPQTGSSVVRITHADEVQQRFVIREEIPSAPEISPFRFLTERIGDEWRSRTQAVPEHPEYPQIHLYSEEELKVLLGRDEPTQPLLLESETSTEPVTPQRPVRQPGISTGGASSRILRRSGCLRGESVSSHSTEERSEAEASPKRGAKGKSPAKSLREKKEEQVRMRLRMLDNEEISKQDEKETADALEAEAVELEEREVDPMDERAVKKKQRKEMRAAARLQMKKS